jgi:hypothetical protein
MPTARNQALSNRDRAQRTRETTFQLFPFPSISGADSRLIKPLRAWGTQKISFFLLLLRMKPASFRGFRRRPSASPSRPKRRPPFRRRRRPFAPPCFHASHSRASAQAAPGTYHEQRRRARRFFEPPLWLARPFLAGSALEGEEAADGLGFRRGEDGVLTFRGRARHRPDLFRVR